MEERMIEEKEVERRIRLKKNLLSLGIVFILVLVVFISLNGGGDSSVIPSNVLQFGSYAVLISLVYLFFRIKFYGELLKDKFKLRQSINSEKNEQKRLLHEKSGGDVWTVMFVIITILAVIASQYNVVAFYTTYAILIFHILVKIAYYIYYRLNSIKK